MAVDPSRVDPYVELYAARMGRMSASEVRALFAVASRPEVISLAGGMPSVEAIPIEDVLAATEVALATSGHRVLQYCAGIGLAELRERLVQLMAGEGVSTSLDRVLVTVGGQQALDVAAKVLLNPGDPIVVEAPSYVGALSAFAAYEPQFVTVPVDKDGMDVEALEAVLGTGIRPKFVYTVPNFSNPAGVTLSLSRRERLIELCRRARAPIIEDNPYGMLRFEGDALPCLHTLDPQNVIYVGTLSKVFAPGMRVGWVVAPPGLLERLVLAKEAADLCSGSFSQLVAKAYLDGPRFQSNLSTLVDLYRRRRDAMLEALAEHFSSEATWTHPAGGFYIWVTLPQPADVGSLLTEAVHRGVAFVPGTAFYPDGRGADQMRLAFCHPPEGSIRKGVERLGELLQGGPGDRRPGRARTASGG